MDEKKQELAASQTFWWHYLLVWRPQSASRENWMPLLLRLGLALVFIFHGYTKLLGDHPGISGYASFLDNVLHVPWPTFFAWAVALSEFFGGLAMLLGLFTSFFATLIIIDMLMAWFLTKWPRGLMTETGFINGEFELLIVFAAVALAVAGAGKWSLDYKLLKRK